MHRKRVFQKVMRKDHDLAVNKIAEHPEILEINGLNSETLLHAPFKFPELRKKGQETGDLIFIYRPYPKEWVILVIEVQIGPRRPAGDVYFKLNMTFNYLKSHWREWFRSIGLELPKDDTLWIWIETAFVTYVGKAIWEQPFVEVRRIRIK